MYEKSNLDLMRAFAVVLVVIDHTMIVHKNVAAESSKWGWLGVFGVYLFFVHTALVLMWSLERRPHTLDFYVRRIFRIYPLAVVVILLIVALHVLVVGHVLLLFETQHLSLKEVLMNLLLVQNLIHSSNVTGVLWSLPLEVQMYVFLPVGFAFVRREEAMWPLLLLWAMCALVLRAETSRDVNTLLTVIPDFLPGIIAYVGFRRLKPSLPGWSFPIFLGLLCLAFMRHPSVRGGWIVCLVLGLALPSFRQIQYRPVVVASHRIAKYSYGIYLMHPLCIILAFSVLRGRPFGVQLCVEVSAIAVLAFLGYHLIEHPMIQMGSRVANRIQRRYETTRGEENPALELA